MSDLIQGQFSWRGNVSSSGSTSFTLNFNKTTPLTDKLVDTSVARVILSLSNEMVEKGFINWSSQFDNTLEFWRKKIEEGDIFYKRDLDNGIAQVSLWVEGYLGDRFENYPEKVRIARNNIVHLAPTKTSGQIICPNCNKETLHYYFNNGTGTNASCYNCGFRCDFSVNE